MLRNLPINKSGYYFQHRFIKFIRFCLKYKFMSSSRSVLLWLVLILVTFPLQTARSVSSSMRKADDYTHDSYFAGLKGHISSKYDQLPIQSANIHISPFGINLSSDEKGDFSLSDILIHEISLPITVTITAFGYGEWVLQDVRLVANDTLILKPQLSSEAYLSIVPPPRAQIQELSTVEELSTILSLLSTNDLSVDQPIPKNIRIRVAGYPYHCDTDRDYKIQIVNFKQYAKNVLPNEWALWSDDSLRAGAMAVKMYAWYWIALDGKWNDADVWDSTCDQVYNPNIEYASTNAAIEYTWNWVLSREKKLIHTSYRRDYDLCIDAHLEGNCMGQIDSEDMAQDGYSWDEILHFFYHDTELSVAIPPYEGGYALRFNGTPGDIAENRALIPLGDPENDVPAPPANIGAKDFTIEWWMKTDPEDNSAPPILCGEHDNWIYGNIIYDRDRAGLPGGFGVSLSDNKIIFGINGDDGENLTLCGKTEIADNEWHHLAIQRRRSDGYLWIYLDGGLEISADGPNGDVSYTENSPSNVDGDHFIGIGAWKLDNEHNLHPFFRGWIDELRLSNTIRYTKIFSPTLRPYLNDGNTVALYHFDDGIGSLVSDTSNALGGPSHGFRQYGGTIDGPEWVISDLFITESFFLPLITKSNDS